MKKLIVFTSAMLCGVLAPAAWLDLHMLVALGGRERAMEEMTALAERVGLRLRRSTQTPTPYSILDYVRA